MNPAFTVTASADPMRRLARACQPDGSRDRGRLPGSRANAVIGHRLPGASSGGAATPVLDP
jgi:hypothetical protein